MTEQNAQDLEPERHPSEVPCPKCGGKQHDIPVEGRGWVRECEACGNVTIVTGD